jgi:hypothetical protein
MRLRQMAAPGCSGSGSCASGLVTGSDNAETRCFWAQNSHVCLLYKIPQRTPVVPLCKHSWHLWCTPSICATPLPSMTLKRPDASRSSLPVITRCPSAASDSRPIATHQEDATLLRCRFCMYSPLSCGLTVKTRRSSGEHTAAANFAREGTRQRSKTMAYAAVGNRSRRVEPGRQQAPWPRALHSNRQ